MARLILSDPENAPDGFRESLDEGLGETERVKAEWEDDFARLQLYVEKNGNARVPQTCTVDGHPLGTWVAEQRGAHRRGKMSDARKRKLESLPGWEWKLSTGPRPKAT